MRMSCAQFQRNNTETVSSASIESEKCYPYHLITSFPLNKTNKRTENNPKYFERSMNQSSNLRYQHIPFISTKGIDPVFINDMIPLDIDIPVGVSIRQLLIALDRWR